LSPKPTNLLTMQESCQGASLHEVEDQELLILGTPVVSAQSEQIGMSDATQSLHLALKLALGFHDPFPQSLDCNVLPILQRRLVHCAVAGLAQHHSRSTQQILRRENKSPIEMHKLPESRPFTQCRFSPPPLLLLLRCCSFPSSSDPRLATQQQKYTANHCNTRQCTPQCYTDERHCTQSMSLVMPFCCC